MRRRNSKAETPASEKPPLRDILDHYGLEYRDVYGWQTSNCPFHTDSTASFRFNLDDGGFVCKTYACGKSGGDSLEFIKLYEECDYPAAIEIAEGITGERYSSVSSRSRGESRSRRVPRGTGYTPQFDGRLPTGRRR